MSSYSDSDSDNFYNVIEKYVRGKTTIINNISTIELSEFQNAYDESILVTAIVSKDTYNIDSNYSYSCSELKENDKGNIEFSIFGMDGEVNWVIFYKEKEHISFSVFD